VFHTAEVPGPGQYGCGDAAEIVKLPAARAEIACFGAKSENKAFV